MRLLLLAGATVSPALAIDMPHAQSGLVRRYTFGNGALRQANHAGTDAEMRYLAAGQPAPATAAGRAAGSAAVLLDDDAFEAPIVVLPSQAFTVMVWLRPLAMGTKTGNDGSRNGMIVANGSGYYDGWRLLVHEDAAWRPSLELGRKDGAAAVQAGDALNIGFWNHLAATWDGGRARLYLDGRLAGEREYAEPAVAPQNTLRVGCAGYGVGSLRMVVDELDIFDRALPAEEIAAEARAGAPTWESQCAQLRDDAQQPASIRTLAALEVAHAWRRAHRLTDARAAYLAISSQPGTLPHLRDEAAAGATACADLLAGRPARNPEAHRQRLRPLPEPGLSFFVSPQGHDGNPGTLEQPFASLPRARDAIRARKANGGLPAGGATVFLRGGRYTVTNTFALTELDSGSSGAPVVYRAWQSERPVFDGGFAVRVRDKVTDPAVLARLPSEARGHVYVADVSAQGYDAFDAQRGYGSGIDNQVVRELYQRGSPLPVARWPNAGMLTVGEVRDAARCVLVCRTNRLARWTQAADLMATGYWRYLWADCTVPVAEVDPAAGVLRLQEQPGYGVAAGQPFHVLNLLEEIDQPGEWYLDRASGHLYVWPAADAQPDDFVLTRLDRPFIEARGARNIAFIGLTLAYGRQHGIVLERCADAVVAGCVIRCLGGTGLIAAPSDGLRVYGNVLRTLGHAGMRVEGGDRRTLTSGHVVIENNDVGFFARCTRTYNPALLLAGCGARVAHNHFHDAPSSAMRIEGNDHSIEYNLVDHVVQESDDQGALDIWGNPSYRGVVIRYNRWQDIGGGNTACGQGGIRLDDAISGVVIYGNRFERASRGSFGGVQIHGGQFNIVDGNLFVDDRYGVTFSPWGTARWHEYLARENIHRQLYDEVDVRQPPYSTRYPELAELQTSADLNRVWRNVFVDTGRAFPNLPPNTELWGNRIFAETPDAAALAARSSLPDLPARDEVGLYDDPLRAGTGAPPWRAK